MGVNAQVASLRKRIAEQDKRIKDLEHELDIVREGLDNADKRVDELEEEARESDLAHEAIQPLLFAALDIADPDMPGTSGEFVSIDAAQYNALIAAADKVREWAKEHLERASA